jgi:hypothetical protein
MDANDVLMGGGGTKSANLDQQGVQVGGRIVGNPKAYQVREYDPNTPGGGPLKFFPSGDPIMGICVDVQTSQRDDGEDNGVRRLYLEKKRQLDAVRDAVRAAGATGLQVGGELWIAWTGYATDGKNPTNPPNQAQYRAPTVAIPGADASPAPAPMTPPSSATPQAPVPAAATPPATQANPATAAALGNLDPAQLQQLLAAAAAQGVTVPAGGAQQAPPF